MVEDYNNHKPQVLPLRTSQMCRSGGQKKNQKWTLNSLLSNPPISCRMSRNIRALFVRPKQAVPHESNMFEVHQKDTESGSGWDREGFKSSACVWKDLPEQLSDSSLCFHACVLWIVFVLIFQVCPSLYVSDPLPLMWNSFCLEH